jgi:glycerophosphodiester phosphodiesterase
MGANVVRGGALAPAWRENTLRSFQAAAASGAAFVEFDVQVTADGVPVIWHDDLVEYGDPARPTQCAVSDLTAAEFQALGALSASGKCQQLSVVRSFKTAAATAAAGSDSSNTAGGARLAAAIAAAGEGGGAPPPRRRWCCEADDTFPTLEQLFGLLPAHLAFNIEVKMATPPELAATPADEIERMVRPILDVVARCSGGRPVVFSSFDPDVCRALRARAAPAHRVMFLSTGGTDWHADARRMSLAAAVAEAAASGLCGVVVDSGALQAHPEAVAAAREAGLALLTYGLQNDAVGWVLQQQALGVAGVIVDDLEGLMAALRSGAAGAPAAAAAVAATDAGGAAAAAAAAAAAGSLVGQVVAAQAAGSAAALAAGVLPVAAPAAAAALPPAVVAS